MKPPIPIRLAGLAVAVTIAASACSAGGASSSDGTTFDPTPSSASQPQPLEVVEVSVEELGVRTVVPQGWARSDEGLFVGDDAELAFGGVPSWFAPDPIDLGYQAPDRVQRGGRAWDLYRAVAGGQAQLLATTAIGANTYLVWIGTQPDGADRLDAVVAPVLDAFEVDVAPPTGDEITLDAATIDGRSVAYAAGGSGEPTVVFEAGHGDGMAVWQLVAPTVAGAAQVFLYDRPGYGGSDHATTPRDAATMVAELRELLAATGHEPPFVLVGHSLGGTVMDLFARTHPDEVAGLVLVDSRHHEYTSRCVEALGEVPDCTAGDGSGLPPQMLAEWRALPATEQELAAAPGFDADLDLVVVTAGIDTENLPAVAWELWHETQRDYASLVPGARHVVAEQSGHGIPLEQPDAIVDAVAGLLSS